ncbi:MAG: hypothetical protein M3209_03340 [Acidobacteriota bacterium]|nr:hypothetical protein [Acidobacteriota bacterium]
MPNTRSRKSISKAGSESIRTGKLKRGDIVVFCASGGGINMAAMVFRY